MNKINTKKQKGSATILVILIVLTVVLFGVLNMMTVYTSYKISQKNLTWARTYYEFDSKAQIFASNIQKSIESNLQGKEIDTKKLLLEVEKNVSDDKEILINGNKVKLPIDKNKKIVQNNHIDIKVYFYDENGKKAFYIDMDVPSKKSKNCFEVVHWMRVSEDFEYNTEPEFGEGEVLVVQ